MKFNENNLDLQSSSLIRNVVELGNPTTPSRTSIKEIVTVWSSSTTLSFRTRMIAKASLVSEAMLTVGVTSSTTISPDW